MKVVNVVATAKLQHRLDLHKLASTLSNIEYKPRKLPAVIMRIRKPVRSTCLVYGNGSLVCTGATSPQEARQAVDKFCQKIRHIYPEITVNNFQVRNMVGSVTLPFKLDLEKIAMEQGSTKTGYQPELFPGLFYFSQIRNIKVTMFRSGKLHIAGARDSHELDNVMEEIVDVIVGSFTT